MFVFFFFNDTSTTEIYTLSLHDALPISEMLAFPPSGFSLRWYENALTRSEEHTSELQSRLHLVCRLLLEKKKKTKRNNKKSRKFLNETRTLSRTYYIHPLRY